ncbi:hypothetical protein MSKU3_0527 [Komagataeibacter oboediens]|nr:hypothetical protein MSKU3_0527 [Komagataeibacter oboediens]
MCRCCPGALACITGDIAPLCRIALPQPYLLATAIRMPAPPFRLACGASFRPLRRGIVVTAVAWGRCSGRVLSGAYLSVITASMSVLPSGPACGSVVPPPAPWYHRSRGDAARCIHAGGPSGPVAGVAPAMPWDARQHARCGERGGPCLSCPCPASYGRRVCCRPAGSSYAPAPRLSITTPRLR